MTTVNSANQSLTSDAYVLDKVGNRTQVTDQTDLVTHYTYNARNEVTWT